VNGYLVLIRHLRGDVPVLFYTSLDVAAGAANAFCPNPELNQYRCMTADDVGRPISADVVEFVNSYPKRVVHRRIFDVNTEWEPKEEQNDA